MGNRGKAMMEHASGERGIHERCRERTFESRKGILAHARRHHLRTHSPHRGVLRRYASTDDGIFTDGSMFVTCALFIVALLIFSRSRRELGATAVQWIMVGSIIVAAGASMALSLLDSADQALVATAFASALQAPWPCRCACSTGCAACAAPTK